MADDEQGEGGYGLEPDERPPSSQVTRLPAKSQVDLSERDLPCRRCGFNLRGLQQTGNCPECGTPIWMTLEGDPLLYSSPEYLRTLSHGLAWILAASICYFAILLGAFAMTVIGIFIGPNASVAGTISWEAISIVIDVPLSAALLYGWWKFSTPDPGIVVGNRGDRPRLVVRWASIAALGISLLATMGTLLATQTMSPTAAGDVFSALQSVAGIASLVQFFGSLVYMHWIADRMKNPALAEQAQKYLWLLPLIFILGACVMFIGPLVAWILYLLLLNEVRTGINVIMDRQNHELMARVQSI